MPAQHGNGFVEVLEAFTSATRRGERDAEGGLGVGAASLRAGPLGQPHSGAELAERSRKIPLLAVHDADDLPRVRLDDQVAALAESLGVSLGGAEVANMVRSSSAAAARCSATSADRSDTSTPPLVTQPEPYEAPHSQAARTTRYGRLLSTVRVLGKPCLRPEPGH